MTEDLLPCIAYFHLLLLHFFFFVLCLLLILVCLDIYLVLFVLDLDMKYTVEMVPLCMYNCVVCYRVIPALFVRSVVHVFEYLYTLDDDSESLMDHETFFLYTKMATIQ